jgi:hypothetical protein
MINLVPLIERIRVLLQEDTDQSVTYAALEARLALEKVCYDRLRQRHDYVSHADLIGWTPSYVINKIMTDVDPDVHHTMTLMIGVNPDNKPEEDNFVEVGTEVGFVPRRISSMWNALSKLALHVRLPESRQSQIPDYGDKSIVRAKVEQVVAELERISKGNMTFSGIGEEVSFDCHCGQKNKRRASLLKPGQTISCFNPDCSSAFKVEIEDDGRHSFVLDSVEIPCAACGEITLAPRRELLKMDYEQIKLVRCFSCGHENRIAWTLGRADLASTSARHRSAE